MMVYLYPVTNECSAFLIQMLMVYLGVVGDS